MAISSNGLAGLKTGVCTSTTRPSGPYEGQMIYETDTDMVAVWNGSAWRYVSATTPTNGTVLQIVTASTSTNTTTTSSALATTGLSATITPKSTTSKILVIAAVTGCKTAAVDTGIEFAFFRGGSNILTFSKYAGYSTSSTDTNFGIGGILFDSPSTVSATTYDVRFARATGSGTVEVQQGGLTTSTIVLQEISA
jgi:hypothetical protein